ncbi:hypothetical protein IGI04_030214 [Brassica rapa subsp. trilocularis]|uniref:Uncharacterized protein n=1 Tax=Brassica rapa subsp. trilocularis TaxID=1813537 RepID=A0ABQ7LQ24_BRACM|nr:hypothetical protein IGI04_030214 [Brassica rapa subsp. trilocularis]
MISLSIFTLELDNEIDRRDPIFIENKEVSLAPRTGMTCSGWAPSAKGCALSATCIPSPILIGFGSDRSPKYSPSLLDLAHGLVQRPNSPWPHGQTSQPATGMDPNHRPKTRTVCRAEMS